MCRIVQAQEMGNVLWVGDHLSSILQNSLEVRSHEEAFPVLIRSFKQVANGPGLGLQFPMQFLPHVLVALLEV